MPDHSGLKELDALDNKALLVEEVHGGAVAPDSLVKVSIIYLLLPVENANYMALTLLILRHNLQHAEFKDGSGCTYVTLGKRSDTIPLKSLRSSWRNLGTLTSLMALKQMSSWYILKFRRGYKVMKMSIFANLNINGEH